MAILKLIAILGIILTVNEVASQEYTTGSTCCTDYCFTTDFNRGQVKQFSTKTAYDFVKQPNSENFFSIPNCEAVKFWMVSRHGTRLPTASDIELMKELSNERDEIIKNYEVRRTKPDRGPLCIQDLDLLRAWRWDYNISVQHAEHLTTQGWNDLKFLALHYRHSFSRLLKTVYQPNEFLFRHTNSQRAEASYKAFVEGLFGVGADSHIQLADVPKDDYLLQPYDQCPAWDKKNDNNPNAEHNKFADTVMFKEMVDDVSTKMGFKYPLTPKQIETMWDMCRYEQSWFITKLSPWCSVFTKPQIDMLEYKEDIKYFYKSGHGRAINSKIPCELMKDLIMRLNSTDNPKTVAYFAHDSLIQTMLVALNTYKDHDMLRADNYELLKRVRQWRTSQLIPFSANIVAVKYDCPNEPVRDKMTMFINEKPINFDWCNVGLCDMSKFIETYRKYLDADCREYFCSESSGTKIKFSLALVIPFIVAVFLKI